MSKSRTVKNICQLLIIIAMFVSALLNHIGLTIAFGVMALLIKDM